MSRSDAEWLSLFSPVAQDLEALRVGGGHMTPRSAGRLVDEVGHVWTFRADRADRIPLRLRHGSPMYVSGLDPRDMMAVYRVPADHAEAFWESVQPLLDDPGDHGSMVIPTVLLDRPHERRHKGKSPQDAVILLEITCA